MRQVTLDEAPGQIADLVDAAIHGEQVFITQNGKQLVQLVPAPSSAAPRRAGSAKGLVTIADDFDESLEDFREYMQ